MLICFYAPGNWTGKNASANSDAITLYYPDIENIPSLDPLNIKISLLCNKNVPAYEFSGFYEDDITNILFESVHGNLAFV